MAESFPGGSAGKESSCNVGKNHVVPTAWQDEALARNGVSREVPCSALKGETAHTPAACSFPGENARSWEALGEARPGQSSLSAGALRGILVS